MSTLTIGLSDESLRTLKQMAEEADTTPEELVRTTVEEWLTRDQQRFEQVVDHVLRKNAELYRRLA